MNTTPDYQKLALVASKTDNAVIITNSEGIIEWVNESFTRISGYTFEEAIGKKPSTILQGEDTDPETISRIRQKLNAQQSFTEEILNYHKNGSTYWLRMYISPVFDEKQRLTNFIAIESDITLDRFYQENLLAQKRAAEDAHLELQKAYELIVAQNEEITTQKDDIEQKKHEIELQNKNILNSINYAKRIQEAILGDKKRITQKIPQSFVFFRPKDIVSGDFYWYTEINNPSWLRYNSPEGVSTFLPTPYIQIIIAADCTGHGVPGAFMTVLGNALLNSIINENRRVVPHQILEELDQRVIETLNKELKQKNQIQDGMDLAVVVLDRHNDLLHYAGSKNPLYFIRDYKLWELEASRYPIGGMNTAHTHKHFHTHTLPLKPNDSIYIFSDGFHDQFGGEHRRKYMKRRFRDFLVSINELPMSEQEEVLEQELLKWKGSYPQTDDILVIGFRW